LPQSGADPLIDLFADWLTNRENLSINSINQLLRGFNPRQVKPDERGVGDEAVVARLKLTGAIVLVVRRYGTEAD